jgi:hypothetical protein
MTTEAITPRRAARIAGIGYLAIFFLAIFANFFVVEALVESGDAAVTAANIADSEGMFRAGLVAFTVVFVLDVVIAWALYVLFRGVNRDLSLLTAWFRLTYTVLLGVGLVFFFVALRVVTGSGFEGAGADAQALLAIEAFEFAWLIGLVCFGAHLILLGRLVVRSGEAPRALGWVLAAAGAAYIADTLARAVLSDYASVEGLFLAIVAVPSVIGELWFTIWLLAKAGRHAPEAEAPPETAASAALVG